MRNKRRLGKDGEELAVQFLKDKGYRILEKNYRFGKGEIDIIAKDRDTVIFIEVKSRRSSDFGSPEEAVDFRKQRQLSKLALAWLQKNRLFNRVNCRFDVMKGVFGVDYYITNYTEVA